MPTRDPSLRLDLERALARVAERAFPEPANPQTASSTRAVGLEQERFLVELDTEGRPGRRLALSAVAARVLARAKVGDSLLLPADEQRYPPHVDLARGGTLTFEPGGQIEHSTCVHPSATGALADLRAVVHKLEQIFDTRRVRLVAVGLDPWHTPKDVPQQLDAPRYRAMDEFFALRGPAGAYMMRLSCSLQVNLDLGAGSVREERWTLANLLSPAVTALFTTSPGEMDGVHWASRRARVWQTIDPTRAAVPPTFLEHPEWSPGRQYAEAALDADVMLVRTAPGVAVTGRPGWNMRQWIRDGHPEHGFPTEEDLDYHLTTLFFDVRPRGFLELRTIDALPYCFRPAPVAFFAGLLYDNRARHEALELLLPRRAQVVDLYERAARLGHVDQVVRRDATELYRLALEGVSRLGSDFLDAAGQAAALDFGERFPERGRAPGDEFAQALERGPAEGLDWAMSSGCGGAGEAVAEGAAQAGCGGPRA